jgi:hypothetical protein
MASASSRGLEQPVTHDEHDIRVIRSRLPSVLGLDVSVDVDEFHPETARRTNRRRFFRIGFGGKPRIMLKLPTSLDDDRVRAELRHLWRLQAVSAPRPFCAWGRGFAMDYVGVADFPTVFRSMNRLARLELIERVVDQIAALHVSARVERTEALSDVLEQYVGEARHLVQLPPTQCTEVGQAHGDLGPWNIRIDEAHRPQLIDWEDYRQRGIPWLDLLNFAVSLPLLCFSERPTLDFERLFDATFLDHTDSSECVQHAIAHYVRRRGVALRDLLAWVPVFCESMNHRIRSQGRSLDNMYYPTFQRRFVLDEIIWAGKAAP